MTNGFMVVDSHPLGWGYDSQTGTNTGGTCLDSTGVVVSDDEERLDVYYDWSATQKEAETDIAADLTGDADLGVISGELSGSYDGTFSNTNVEEALTIAVRLKTVHADFGTSFTPGEESRCDPEQPQAGALADFLQNCGDRYISRKEMGGYIFLIASKENLDESEKHEVSGSLDVDFGFGEGGLNGLVDVANDLIERDFTVRVQVFGLTELLANLNAGPSSGEVEDPGAIFSSLLDDEGKPVWSKDAANDVWTGQNYGGVIDQTMKKYKETFFEDCTGSDPGEVLQCYTSFFEETESYVPEYQRWLFIIDTRLNTQGEYFWGRTTAQAQDNKDAHSRASDVISSCLTRIDGMGNHCAQVANTTSATQNDICPACNQQLLYHCDDTDNDGLCDSDGTKAEFCSKRNLGDLYEALPDVVPTHDATDYGAQLVTKSQHEPSNNIQPTSTHMCVLSGVKGKMSGSGETVHIFDNGGQWHFAVGSQQGDDDGETLRARAFCSLTSNFFDTNGSMWSTKSDLDAITSGGVHTESFMDGSNPLDDKYATVINGMSGKFQGGGEYVKIERGSSPMSLKVRTQQTTVVGYASAFGLDAPTGGSFERGAKFSYSVGTNSKPSKKYAKDLMIPTDDGICYFHQIIGDFDGGGEGVRILKKDGMWVLRAKAACKDHDGLFGGGACNDRKNVQAVASCYLYDQTG